MEFLKPIKHLFIFIFLTALTQVGGLIWVLSIWSSKRFKIRNRYVFPIIYLISNLLIIPSIAKSFGREQLPIFSKELKPRNWCYPLLFCNYVTYQLKTELENSAHTLFISHKTSITCLDANFPFFDGFPLLPHLSHDDGKKVDISFIYLGDNRIPTDKKPSVSGYGVYVKPNKTRQIQVVLIKGIGNMIFRSI